jgi:chromosome segregation protein
MLFSQIELHGFKSFADRTQVNLGSGITAIVGPNGCGKSNILDALRWALGEQSAKALRGAHMQDIIFNGSEHRPATGMAEVSLSFDNSDSTLPVDFAEVKVTRRVFRSGESEYLLNQAPCRLRDIQELFMDTGIGTNAYSLIGQGKIDLVLSSKPEDRRFLFEEAAGIIKYKSRKRVAMRKLDSASQNHLRLNDIIAEVQRQMRSLKRQVNAAIRHREITAALRDLEIRNAWLQYNELTGRIADLNERFAEAQDTYTALSTKTAELEAEAETQNLKRLEIERQLTERRDAEYRIDAEMERIESQVALLRKEADFCRQQEEQARDEHQSLTERAQGVLGAQEETSAQFQALENDIHRAQDALDARQQAYNEAAAHLAEADAALEVLRARTLEEINARNRTQTELETVGAGLANIESQLEAIAGRLETAETRRDELSAHLRELREKQRDLESTLAQLEAKRQELADRRAKTGESLQQRNTEWQTLRERKSSLDARLTSLRELRDSYEGFAAGVKAVMQAKQQDLPEAEGIIGPVGDLLSTDPAFERAIEAALGGNINNIVVEKAEAAKSAINYLKRNQAGRVTFLPLDIIRPGAHDDSESLAGQPGVIGKAIDQVQCEARILPAIQYLLFNTMIVETIDDAIRIARNERRYPRLVTLDGEVVSSAGAVTGGRLKHENRGLLGRSAEIADLETRLETIDREVATLAADGQRLATELEELNVEIGGIEKEVTGLRRETGEAGMAVTRAATELESLEQSVQQLSQQRDTLHGQRAELEQRRETALQKAGVMDSDGQALQQQIAEAQEAAAQARQALSECGAELADLRVQLAGLTQSLEEADRNRMREQREHTEFTREAEKRLEMIAQFQARAKDFVREAEEHLERSKALSTERDEAHARVLESQSEQQTLIASSDKTARELKELHKKTGEAQNEVHRIELDLRHKEDLVAAFQERISTEYHLNLATLDENEVGTDEFDEDEREKLITEHRERLQRMGTVNLMAIEEYEELEKRNDFLVSQEEDLRKASELLMSVVQRIDATILDMFMNTFRVIEENFKGYFRRLFNGGQARIYLLDEDDPLESGIEIEARPPGKKPQVISLLSGGEQAMTAIALLFGIFSAKPSPFCVLDEVDAPLDDANIMRFLDLVEEFSNENQFIMITHNKQTMSRANALFGVTQQEKGISQLVSVRFEEVQEIGVPV